MESNKRGVPSDATTTHRSSSVERRRLVFGRAGRCCARLKDRGSEQGDVDGPLECSITLAQVARKTRITLARLQRPEELPWIAENEAGAASARADFDGRADRTRTFEAGPETDEAVRIDLATRFKSEEV